MTTSKPPRASASANADARVGSVISSRGYSRSSARRTSARSSGLSSIRSTRTVAGAASCSGIPDVGSLVHDHPVELQRLDQLEEGVEVDRLRQIGVGPEVV